ncbi:MAG: phosphate signaling complex protein PhoU [Gemmataceae bacterium]
MTKHFQRDMDRLQREILSLAASVEEAISTAIKSLQHRDVELAEEVINGDQPIDLLENRIEEECLKVVALHQPVAIDLRQVATVFMLNTDLERMADLAVDIAERTVVLAKLPPVPIPDRLGRMTDLTTQMVRQGLDAFVNMDTQLARQVIRTDDEVDRLNQEIIDELVLMMRKNADRIEPGLSLFSATRHLERIADHATNIAEDVIYLVEGEIIRHHPEAVENT